MLSILITTFKEPETLKKSLDIIIKEISKADEILIVGPDEETEKIAKQYTKFYPQIRYLKDEGKGKAAALNLAFKKAKGDILILTDGDVWPEKGFMKELLRPFENSKIGIVTGRPISINPRDNMFGYWSHFLTEAANQRRLFLSKKNRFIDCSGYLYAIRKTLIIDYQLPTIALAEDDLISQMTWQRGYQIAYAPLAKVYVKYPDNFSDWILQKRRSVGGYVQMLDTKKRKIKKEKMRNFLREAFYGFWLALVLPKNFKEFYWTILLFGARLYLWILIFLDHKIRRKRWKEGWERVESTK